MVTNVLRTYDKTIMKTVITHLIKPLLILLAAITFLSSCKKEKQPDPTPATTPTGTVILHLHSFVGLNEVAYDSIYTDLSGRKISLNMAQLYLSGIELQKADGSFYGLSNAKVLKTLENEEYILGTAPVGNYKSFRFKVGLDAGTNAADPSTNAALLNHTEMWFNTTAQPDGYVFMNVQGKVDTTAGGAGPDANMQNFVFKIGTNAHYKQVTMPDQPFSILQDQAQFVHMYIDYGKLFTGIDLHQPLMVGSVADNTSALSNAVTNNIPLIFNYE